MGIKFTPKFGAHGTVTPPQPSASQPTEDAPQPADTPPEPDKE